MTRHILISLTLVTLAFAANAQPTTANAPTNDAAPKTDFSKLFSSEKEKNSYAIGMMWAAGIKAQCQRQDVEYDPEVLAKAFAAALTGTPTVITDEQEHEVLNDLNKVLRAKFEEKRKKMAEQQAEESKVKGEKNMNEGKAFLAKNQAMPGVKTLPSGLQYKVLTDGAGPIPAASDNVTVKYRGTLIDGTEFDSSEKHGGTFTTRVQGQVVPGWTEALEHMKTGSKWEIYLPSDLAYGPSGRGPVIGPNAVLVFELELLSTMPATAAAVNTPPPSPLTSDIIKVPSAEEMKKGAKIETIKAEDLERKKTRRFLDFLEQD